MNACGGGCGTTPYGGGGGGGRIAVTFNPAAQSNDGPATAYTVRLEGGRGALSAYKGAPGMLYMTDPQNLPAPWPRNAILCFGVTPSRWPFPA